MPKYVSRATDRRDTYEVVDGDRTVAIIRAWASTIEVEPVVGALSPELENLVEAFVAELIESPEAIASVAGWSPEYRESARRLAAARTSTKKQPSVEGKPAAREGTARRLRLAYRG